MQSLRLLCFLPLLKCRLAFLSFKVGKNIRQKAAGELFDQMIGQLALPSVVSEDHLQALQNLLISLYYYLFVLDLFNQLSRILVVCTCVVALYCSRI